MTGRLRSIPVAVYEWRVPLTLEELRADVERGEIDTVLLVMTDMQGRLQGKRLHAPFFCDEVAAHGAEGCYYLLTVDVDMMPVQGFEMASWESGYGDFVFHPDMSTLRRIPWLEKTALVVCDIQWQDGRPVAPSPRQILRRQLDRLAERGLIANIGSELEFFLFRETYDSGPREALPRPDPGEPVQRRLLDPRNDDGRGRDPPDPARHGGRRTSASRTRRASATSASTR